MTLVVTFAVSHVGLFNMKKILTALVGVLMVFCMTPFMQVSAADTSAVTTTASS
jgi:hypothetical protein